MEDNKSVYLPTMYLVPRGRGWGDGDVDGEEEGGRGVGDSPYFLLSSLLKNTGNMFIIEK